MLRVRQIHYNDTTLAECEYIAYDNSKMLTVYFENEVIRKLIDANDTNGAAYYGVFSHSFKQKCIFFAKRGNISPEQLDEWINENPETDCFSFFGKLGNENVVKIASDFHPNFTTLFKEMLNRSGLPTRNVGGKIPTVYYNHIVARSPIYEEYVHHYLKPCMNILEQASGDFKRLIWEDAKYPMMRKEIVRNRLKEALGLDYYPYHPFLLERLWSVFLADNPKINIQQW